MSTLSSYFNRDSKSQIYGRLHRNLEKDDVPSAASLIASASASILLPLFLLLELHQLQSGQWLRYE